MDDSRLFIAILALGLLAAIAKILDLFDSEPIMLDARDNGGVRSTAWSGTSHTP